MLVASLVSGCLMSHSTSLMVALSSHWSMLKWWVGSKVCGVVGCHVGPIRGVVATQAHLSWIQTANLCLCRTSSLRSCRQRVPLKGTPGLLVTQRPSVQLCLQLPAKSIIWGFNLNSLKLVVQVLPVSLWKINIFQLETVKLKCKSGLASDVNLGNRVGLSVICWLRPVGFDSP